MVGKKSGKALRDEGLERTDNNMELSNWPQIAPINQKNYYTDYLKRDDQYLAFRLQNEETRNRMAKTAKDRDRALALAKANDLGLPEPEADADGDTNMEDGTEETAETLGSKVIVIHVGSQNLRIGLASDALPKTVPMVIARKSTTSESEDHDEPSPKRLKLDDGYPMEPEKMFGPEFSSQYTTMVAELKGHMRQNKRRTLPNSKEMVINYNRRTVPETIPEHNDPLRIEWTDIEDQAPEYIVGQAALRIPDDSKPRYKLYWPMRYGWCNEKDYDSKRLLFLDVALILEDTIKNQLGVTSKKDWAQYSCVFVIPDLYEKTYVTQVLDMLMREFSFARVCFIQESLAATFGAGFTSACVVDIGAQKTSICCVEEGMCIENSRVNLKFGGADVTEAFIKMMMFDHFPYAEINLWRRYDFLLAEELKKNVCTLNEASVSVQVFDFHLRIAGQDTRKYSFKAYDEVHLAPMGYFQPSIFDNSEKLEGRRKFIIRSVDIYDSQPNDPTSAAQSEILTAIAPPLANGQVNGEPRPVTLDVQATPSRSQQVNALSRVQELDATPRSSVAGSPAPEAVGTPHAGGGGTPLPNGQGQSVSQPPRAPTVEERDDILPVFPLDNAILTSIAHAARSDERKMRDFLGGIMVVGGGSLVNGFHSFLEERLQTLRPGFANEIMVGTPPRDLDPQVVVWKGASVFGKLSGTNDSWIGQLEYDRLGHRLMAYKCMWAY
ncbi:putative chromatin remodeling complex subunit (Arp8) [Aspergillus clavatus NRRL 1]|uniref:Chromatin remodeling complex subunit (Arp8), putative n=1 Tax=Aspergillus clavatus (strain ATCC 1007 / CBS 513.65 / DSM 816 / NCTC 3887 / NRRL 1 / QM 1276 / 107) TaxID=344612 RepID=A1C6E4_ASPCL|nr:chromatin remodeling complex subunit (Arp8), putative [Aspergillus clavatus NRRL 1]EAW13965.1 chromatin remodeling complex subunit (Arp8), putative [Aspergillus clavatus NRRL 1]